MSCSGAHVSSVATLGAVGDLLLGGRDTLRTTNAADYIDAPRKQFRR
jgi:hypothetical protein